MKLKIKQLLYKLNPIRFIFTLYLCLRYPFLRWYGNPLYQNYPQLKYFSLNYTWYYEIPRGWRKAFGKQLLKDIKTAGKPYLKKINTSTNKKYTWRNILKWEQIKEKYGELRLYASTKKDIQKVLDRYELMSSGYCISCGKPARYCSKGWIEFYCDRCFEKFECWRYENQGRTYKRVPLSKEEAAKCKEECRIDESYIPKITKYKYETLDTFIFTTVEERDSKFEELWKEKLNNKNNNLEDIVYKKEETIFEKQKVYLIKKEKQIKYLINLKETYNIDFKELWGLNK